MAVAGIVVQAVHFDCATRAILVDFTLAGQAQTKIIPFSEIEDLFTEATIRPPGDAPPAKLDRGGIPPPP